MPVWQDGWRCCYLAAEGKLQKKEHSMKDEVKLVASSCGAGPCPSVHEDGEDYLVVGHLESPDRLPDGSVGEGEAVVRVPKSLVNITAR